MSLTKITLGSVIAFATKNHTIMNTWIIYEHYRIVCRIGEGEYFACRLSNNLFASGDFIGCQEQNKL